MPQNPFELLEPPAGGSDQVSIEDMHVVMDEVRKIVREGETRGRKNPELQNALSLFDSALKRELERISGPGSRESDFIGILPGYRDEILAQTSEGLRIHLTSFFRENGIHFDRSIFAPGTLDEHTTYMRSLYMQAFVISILQYRHLIGEETARDELAALKLATRYGEQFVKEYFHGSYILDTLNKNLQASETPWTESEVADIFQESVRKHIAVSNIASVESALVHVAENVRFLRDSARVAEVINASLKEGEERWTEPEVANIFRESMRKHIAVSNIASVESALARVAGNVRFLRDSARVAEVINASLKEGEDLWTESEVADIFQESVRKYIAVTNIGSVKSALQNLRVAFQENISIYQRLSAASKSTIARKFGIKLR